MSLKPPSRTRKSVLVKCLGASVLVHTVLLSALLAKGFIHRPVSSDVSTPVVIDVMMGAPPAPPVEAAPRKEQPEPPPSPSRPKTAPPQPQTVPQAPSPLPVPAQTRTAPPASTVPSISPPGVTPPRAPNSSSSASAPPSTQAPPAQRATRTSAADWHAQVMAKLERSRRYPPFAERRRLEGTATVRFRMSRDGRVLSSRLERSSGHPELDRAAIDTPRRAQPLPAIPADRSDPAELVVAVEFFL